MKTIRAIRILIPVLVLIACGVDEPLKQPADDISDFTVNSAQSDAVQGDFIYRLISEKEQYTEGEEIKVYAELEYNGAQENIEISHAASPFHFPISEETRKYVVEYAMNEPLLTTRLTKGEPLHEDYTGSGGYSAEEDEAYIEFVQRIMEKEFPPGYYKIDGFANFTATSSAGSATPYEIHTQIDFKVVPEN